MPSGLFVRRTLIARARRRHHTRRVQRGRRPTARSTRSGPDAVDPERLDQVGGKRSMSVGPCGSRPPHRALGGDSSSRRLRARGWCAAGRRLDLAVADGDHRLDREQGADAGAGGVIRPPRRRYSSVSRATMAPSTPASLEMATISAAAAPLAAIRAPLAIRPVTMLAVLLSTTLIVRSAIFSRAIRAPRSSPTACRRRRCRRPPPRRPRTAAANAARKVDGAAAVVLGNGAPGLATSR